MKDTTIVKICFIIVLTGIVLLAITYKPEFEKSTILKLTEKDNSKGIIYGRIDFVEKNYPITLFILNDTSTALIYYPKPTTLEVNDFVEVYAESEPQPKESESLITKKKTTTKTLYAYKVIKK
jgi:hypothetical protein